MVLRRSFRTFTSGAAAAAFFTDEAFNLHAWASRNPSQNTSRDRFRQNTIEREIAEFESALAALGFGSNYCQAIRARAVEGRRDPHSQFLYRAALRRTLAAKERKVAA